MYLVARPPFAFLGNTPPASGQPGRRFMTTDAATAAAGGPGGDEGGEHARLLAAMARGDREALSRLYDLLSRPLYSLAHHVTRDATESQDIVQEVFLQMWTKATVFQTARGSVFGWAATLTRNRAIDRIRIRRRRGELLTSAAEELQPGSPVDSLDSAGSLWLCERAGAVRAALATLAPEQQKVLELAFFNDLTQLEIARRLNEPLGTVKARIRRGLLKLRNSLPPRL